MKKFIAVLLIATFMAGSAFGQEVRKKPSGPRRQLATIVFAGLGGAILGLSTLSFYGRPQDQLSNIAIGFAVGIIAGTVYVTFRSATTREYYDPKLNPDGTPREGLLNRSLESEVAFEEPKFFWGPLIQKSPQEKDTSLGAQIRMSF